MMYVVGYERDDKFIILYKSNNSRLALLMCKKYNTTSEKNVKIKKMA